MDRSREPWTDGAPICKALSWEMFDRNDPLDIARGIAIDIREQRQANAIPFIRIKNEVWRLLRAGVSGA
jgi:hypothetical protein